MNHDALSCYHFMVTQGSRIDGPGVIAGVDNADLKDVDQYTGNTRKAWNGRALVVIRSTRTAGEIKLTVTSPGLSEVEVEIKTMGNTK